MEQERARKKRKQEGGEGGEGGKEKKIFNEPSDVFEPLSEDLIQKVRHVVASRKSLQETDTSRGHVVKVIDDPFMCCIFNGLFDDHFLALVKEELLQEKFVLKRNDLYDFQQSRDLNFSDKKHLKLFRETIYSAGFVGIMEKMTGITLSNKFDMSGHRYGDKSVLLCHDDELQGRRIAYILYLVPETWEKKHGGSLDLYSVDENGQPKDIKVSVTPEWNTFAFFEVTPTSFHQVAEILNPRDERVSISGWFHSPDQIIRPLPFKENFFIQQPINPRSAELEKYLNPIYLKADSISKIKETFLEKSSIELKDFLKPEVYASLLKSLHSESTAPVVGPANRRNYQLLDNFQIIKVPGENVVENLKAVLSSQTFADYLQTLTGIPAKRFYGEIRKFQKSHYTLVHDHSLEPVGLDLVLFCQEKDDWKEDWGGQIVYMDRDEELLTVFPTSNSLLLVFRDEGTMRFVKYINHYATVPRPDISLVYLE